MARINIDDSLFSNSGFQELILKLGCRHSAIGAIVEAYIIAQKFYLNEETGRMIPLAEWKRRRACDSVIDVGLAEIRGDFVYVLGSNDQFSWLLQKSEAGKNFTKKKSDQLEDARRKKSEKNSSTGNDRALNEDERELNGSEALPLTLTPTLSLTPPLTPSLAQTHSQEALQNDVLPTPKTRKPKKSGEMPPTKETWESYRAAYSNRYGVEPIRNLRTNSQLKQFIERVGVAEAPEIVAFYLKHNSQRYTQSAHSTGNLLYDAEKIRTEWARGKQITSSESRSIENKQQVVNAFSKHLPQGERHGS